MKTRDDIKKTNKFAALAFLDTVRKKVAICPKKAGYDHFFGQLQRSVKASNWWPLCELIRKKN